MWLWPGDGLPLFTGRPWCHRWKRVDARPGPNWQSGEICQTRVIHIFFLPNLFKLTLEKHFKFSSTYNSFNAAHRRTSFQPRTSEAHHERHWRRWSDAQYLYAFIIILINFWTRKSFNIMYKSKEKYVLINKNHSLHPAGFLYTGSDNRDLSNEVFVLQSPQFRPPEAQRSIYLKFDLYLRSVGPQLKVLD